MPRNFNKSQVCVFTIDMERFTGLNVHGFNLTGVFVEMILAKSAYYLV